MEKDDYIFLLWKYKNNKLSQEQINNRLSNLQFKIKKPKKKNINFKQEFRKLKYGLTE